MLKLEAKLPGFGGSYIGSLGQVVVYMKPDSPASPELVLVPGWSGYGTSLVLNRVKVGFRDAASVCPGVAAITSMGIPTDAIIPEIWGEMRIG